MKKEKLKWYIASKEYINYLKVYDNKIENINYSSRLKPYLGIILFINNFNYYVPISSPKDKHYKMKEDIDFVKIVKKDRIIGILNLNNMIPISDIDISILDYKKIDNYREFDNEKEKMLYISFLNLELKLINNKIEKIKENAIKLYNEKLINPSSRISKRCCDFRLLEEKCELYEYIRHSS